LAQTLAQRGPKPAEQRRPRGQDAGAGGHPGEVGPPAFPQVGCILATAGSVRCPQLRAEAGEID
jgi:hypothetical protein